MDLGITPQLDVVRVGGRGQQCCFLFGVEVLEGHALRAPVSPRAVLVKAPLPRMLTGVIEIAKLFAAKAIVSDGRDGAFDASLGRSCQVHPITTMRIIVFESRIGSTRCSGASTIS